MVPYNYRTHDFHLFGKALSIGGMAGLHNNANNHDPLIYLRDTAKRVVLIGLHETHNFTDVANLHGIEYHYIPIPDFEPTPIDPAKYDAIYVALKKATAEGKQVAIHCGSGNGRTGTALTSLKLRELIETAAARNPAILDENPGKTTSVHSTINGKVACTPFVKAAVEGIRNQSNPVDVGSKSVETTNDIHTLIAYEKHLRLVIKQELRAKPAVTEDVLSVDGDVPLRETNKKGFWSGLWSSIVHFFVSLVKSFIHLFGSSNQHQHEMTNDPAATASTGVTSPVTKGSAADISIMLADGDSKVAMAQLAKGHRPVLAPVLEPIVPKILALTFGEDEESAKINHHTGMY